MGDAASPIRLFDGEGVKAAVAPATVAAVAPVTVALGPWSMFAVPLISEEPAFPNAAERSAPLPWLNNMCAREIGHNIFFRYRKIQREVLLVPNAYTGLYRTTLD